MSHSPVHFVLLSGLVAISAFAEPAAKPNVIFILADDLGYGSLGCYGQKKVATPNLDRLAAEGLRFTDFYAGSTVCAPSRCSLMTGKHTGHCWVRGNERIPLRPQDVTVAEIFKQAGYITGLVGKWGLGEPDTTGIPNRQGFDYFFGYLNQRHAHDYYPTYLWRNQERVELEGNRDNQRRQYSHDLFTAEALSFIEKNKSGPFFLYLAYTVPHANNERQQAEGMGMEVPDYGPYADRDWTVGQKGHAAMIYRMDRDIGRVMAKLRELGLDENTLVMFSSDNGPHKEGGYDPEFFDSNGPFRGIKRDLTDGGIRVPMIARWPARIRPGVSNVPLAFWDVLPTFAAIVGVEPPADIDGISFLPALLGQDQPKHEYLYWEFHERGFAQGVRFGQYKGIRKNKGPIELYDISTDLGEQTDIADRYPQVAARIERIMDEARTDSEHWPVKISK
ncbi:MAG TPA: arylsulfatase [Phycisphaerae bacterium]|nr:arylsulfatase [Phycisphaerae bacterium]HOJ76025.1 arylsulfatase [Phycisphaerae bacterium]HOM52780.1 arylsulfatase [Phycisphaerae bacterium]HON68934.1 arylsulfatase [Phycisphaerae bacterium]HPP28591.1 arylsulfatase [Phycisphaerae bacterium]